VAPAANATDGTLEITAINGIPVLGHQGVGSITDITIRQILTLPPAVAPLAITSLMSYPSNSTAVAMANHADRITLTFAPTTDAPPVFGQLGSATLTPPQWLDLITRLGEIANPTVTGQRSSAAVTDPPSP
jgi:hypothetical protein